MQGVPATIGNSGDGGVSHQPHQHTLQPHHVNVGGGGGEVGEDGSSTGGGFPEDGDRNSGGNRWPKQETLALIRIRSEMDAAFRDSNLKGPLWDEVSRKLSELGFHRSAKKCREKFENVYKYHRRTKEGRTSKSDKIYRFSDQLQALESNPRITFPQPPATTLPPPVLVAMSNVVTVPSPFHATGSDQNNVSPISVAAPAVATMPPQPVVNHKRTFPFTQANLSGSTDSATSSDTSSDEELPRKKRKWKDFFAKLMKEVIEKQEELQVKFLDALEKRERDRVAKEEAWRAQDIAKLNQEHERLLKERSIAAAKDAAVITFLQKMTGKSPDPVPLFSDGVRDKVAEFATPPPISSTIPVLKQQEQQQRIQQPQPPPQPPQNPQAPPPPLAAPQLLQREAPTMAVTPPVVKNIDSSGGGGDLLSPSPSRWPKAEISALINLRTQLDIKYQENVPKGPLWEEISASMRRLGYNRNARRCKEKWENINKYYKKMKESNKKRSVDSKTCPYYEELDAYYSEKSSGTKMAPIIAQPEQQWPPATVVHEKTLLPQQHTEKGDTNLSFSVTAALQIAPVVTWPEQQWRLQAAAQEKQQHPLSAADMEDQGSDDDDYDDYDDGDEEDDDDDKDGEDGGYEIAPNKMSSMAAV